MKSIEPENMDQETLEGFAAETWMETVLVRGVLIYGFCTFVGCCLTTATLSGFLTKEDLLFNLGIGVTVGAIVGGFFRFAVQREVRRRQKSIR
jgi:hypothetical protein